VAAFLYFFSLGFAVPISGQADLPKIAPAPYKVGERLSYDMSWGIISAGTAVLEVADRQMLAGRPVFKAVHTARSNDFVSAFYPVNNRVETLLDEATHIPYRLVFNRREGKRKNDIEVLFDQTAHKATVTKDGATEILDIPPFAQDTLSIIYFFRTLPSLTVGTSAFADIHHDKKNYHLEVRVEGTEKIRGPLGEFDTIRILAIMPFKGLFLNEGNIRMWVTNDAARVPVLMKAKVLIGSVSATLSSAAGVTLTARP
jgi:hypothetical protein